MITIAQHNELSIKAREEVSDLLHTSNRLGYLKSRWQDEREYEDFAEYKTEIEKVFASIGWRLDRCNQSFGMVVSKGMVRVEVRYGMTKFKVRVL